MDVGITAIGTANPLYKQHQEKTAEVIADGLHLDAVKKRFLKSVYKASGIEYRHSVLSDYCKTSDQFEFFPRNADIPFPTTSIRMQIYKENALHLALSAIQNCIGSCRNVNTITHLITVSCTGMYAPGIDIEIVQHLQLKSDIKRTAINFMGCYGAFNAMKVAHDICRADPAAVVLLVCVELCSIHIQHNMTPSNMVSSAIFADGAAAVMIQADPVQKKYFTLRNFYCDLIPQTNNEMAWEIADHGFDMMLSSYVPELIQSGIAVFMQKILNQLYLQKSDIDFYAIHPGGLKILQACEAALNITSTDNRYAYHILRQYGNMSSATIIFVLKAIWDDLGVDDHDKHIFSTAFGPGLTFESMILKVHHVED